VVPHPVSGTGNTTAQAVSVGPDGAVMDTPKKDLGTAGVSSELLTVAEDSDSCIRRDVRKGCAKWVKQCRHQDWEWYMKQHCATTCGFSCTDLASLKASQGSFDHLTGAMGSSDSMVLEASDAPETTTTPAPPAADADIGADATAADGDAKDNALTDSSGVTDGEGSATTAQAATDPSAAAATANNAANNLADEAADGVDVTEQGDTPPEQKIGSEETAQASAEMDKLKGYAAQDVTDTENQRLRTERKVAEDKTDFDIGLANRTAAAAAAAKAAAMPTPAPTLEPGAIPVKDQAVEAGVHPVEAGPAPSSPTVNSPAPAPEEAPVSPTESTPAPVPSLAPLAAAQPASSDVAVPDAAIPLPQTADAASEQLKGITSKLHDVVSAAGDDQASKASQENFDSATDAAKASIIKLKDSAAKGVKQYWEDVTKDAAKAGKALAETRPEHVALPTSTDYSVRAQQQMQRAEEMESQVNLFLHGDTGVTPMTTAADVTVPTDVTAPVTAPVPASATEAAPTIQTDPDSMPASAPDSTVVNAYAATVGSTDLLAASIKTKTSIAGGKLSPNAADGIPDRYNYTSVQPDGTPWSGEIPPSRNFKLSDHKTAEATVTDAVTAPAAPQEAPAAPQEAPAAPEEPLATSSEPQGIIIPAKPISTVAPNLSDKLAKAADIEAAQAKALDDAVAALRAAYGGSGPSAQQLGAMLKKQAGASGVNMSPPEVQTAGEKARDVADAIKAAQPGNVPDPTIPQASPVPAVADPSVAAPAAPASPQMSAPANAVPDGVMHPPAVAMRPPAGVIKSKPMVLPPIPPLEEPEAMDTRPMDEAAAAPQSSHTPPLPSEPVAARPGVYIPPPIGPITAEPVAADKTSPAPAPAPAPVQEVPASAVVGRSDDEGAWSDRHYNAEAYNGNTDHLYTKGEVWGERQEVAPWESHQDAPWGSADDDTSSSALVSAPWETAMPQEAATKEAEEAVAEMKGLDEDVVEKDEEVEKQPSTPLDILEDFRTKLSQMSPAHVTEMAVPEMLTEVLTPDATAASNDIAEADKLVAEAAKEKADDVAEQTSAAANIEQAVEKATQMAEAAASVNVTAAPVPAPAPEAAAATPAPEAAAATPEAAAATPAPEAAAATPEAEAAAATPEAEAAAATPAPEAATSAPEAAAATSAPEAAAAAANATVEAPLPALGATPEAAAVAKVASGPNATDTAAEVVKEVVKEAQASTEAKAADTAMKAVAAQASAQATPPVSSVATPEVAAAAPDTKTAWAQTKAAVADAVSAGYAVAPAAPAAPIDPVDTSPEGKQRWSVVEKAVKKARSLINHDNWDSVGKYAADTPYGPSAGDDGPRAVSTTDEEGGEEDAYLRDVAEVKAKAYMAAKQQLKESHLDTPVAPVVVPGRPLVHGIAGVDQVAQLKRELVRKEAQANRALRHIDREAKNALMDNVKKEEIRERKAKAKVKEDALGQAKENKSKASEMVQKMAAEKAAMSARSARKTKAAQEMKIKAKTAADAAAAAQQNKETASKLHAVAARAARQNTKELATKKQEAVAEKEDTQEKLTKSKQATFKMKATLEKQEKKDQETAEPNSGIGEMPMEAKSSPDLSAQKEELTKEQNSPTWKKEAPPWAGGAGSGSKIQMEELQQGMSVEKAMDDAAGLFQHTNGPTDDFLIEESTEISRETLGEEIADDSKYIEADFQELLGAAA